MILKNQYQKKKNKTFELLLIISIYLLKFH